MFPRRSEDQKSTPVNVSTYNTQRRDKGDLYTESGQSSQGSFLGVSKPNLAEIYTTHPFAPLGVEVEKVPETTPVTPKTYSEKVGEIQSQHSRQNVAIVKISSLFCYFLSKISQRLSLPEFC